MKKGFILAIAALLGLGSCSSCENKKTETLGWSRLDIPVSPHARAEDEIEVSYPVAEGAFAETANRTIQQTIVDFLGFPGTDVAGTIDSLLLERNASALAGHIPYTIVINGDAAAYGKLSSVTLNLYQYMGGAHGLGNVVCLTFHPSTGEPIEAASLFNDPDSLTRLNRQLFSTLEPEQIEGLFMPVEVLPLPENMALDSLGLHIYYNPYEIAPYSSGPTEYLITLDKLRGLLREDIF